MYKKGVNTNTKPTVYTQNLSKEPPAPKGKKKQNTQVSV